MEHSLLVSHPEGAMHRRAECTQVTLFPYRYWVFEEKARFGPVSGLPGPNAFWETAENGQRPLGETALPGRLCTNLKNPKGSNDRNSVGFEPVYPVFCVGGPKRALLALFWAPGGQGPIRKRQFGRHAKIADENGSNPIRLLKSHVRRERGPLVAPGAPRLPVGGPMSAHVTRCLEPKRKNLKSRFCLQRTSRYLR